MYISCAEIPKPHQYQLLMRTQEVIRCSIQVIPSLEKHESKCTKSNSRGRSQHYDLTIYKNLIKFNVSLEWKKMFCDEKLSVMCVVNDKLTCVVLGLKTFKKVFR